MMSVMKYGQIQFDFFISKIFSSKYLDNHAVIFTEQLSWSFMPLPYEEEFEELAETRDILITEIIERDQFVEMNITLAAKLISNIISNSIKNNHIN